MFVSNSIYCPNVITFEILLVQNKIESCDEEYFFVE